MLNGIESLQFDTRISDAELPIHRADSLIAMLLPTLNLVTEVLDGGNVVSQTLPRQHAEFDLSNVEPAGALGGVMDLQPLGKGMRLCRGKHFVEPTDCATRS